MVTISDLLENVTLQGDIRISAWTRGGEETVVMQTECCNALYASALPKRWRDSEILYMFAPGDGYLHIELSADD